MTTTPPDADFKPARPPLFHGPRADVIAHLMINVVALLHSIGGNILLSRNEQLTADLHDARDSVVDAGERANHLGREHERNGVPAGAGTDEPEHQADAVTGTATETTTEQGIDLQLDEPRAELAADPQ